MKSILLLFALILPSPPAGERQILRVHGIGDQIYLCGGSWTLKAPDAKLVSSENKMVGRHFAGPTWEWSDKSAVTGKVTATEPSPAADSIPWLLLTVVRHEGNGFFSRVTSIQRIKTKGGKAPASGCDAAHSGMERRVAYEADYVFYAKDN